METPQEVIKISRHKSLVKTLTPLFRKIIKHHYSDLGLGQYKKLSRQYCGEYLREIRLYHCKTLEELAKDFNDCLYAGAATRLGFPFTPSLFSDFERNKLNIREYNGEGGFAVPAPKSIQALKVTHEISKAYGCEAHWWIFKKLLDKIYSTTKAHQEHSVILERIYPSGPPKPQFRLVLNNE